MLSLHPQNIGINEKHLVNLKTENMFSSHYFTVSRNVFRNKKQAFSTSEHLRNNWVRNINVTKLGFNFKQHLFVAVNVNVANKPQTFSGRKRF